MITSTRLARVARTTLVLPFLIAALLGLGLRANAATHTPVAASYHHMLAADDQPPGH